MGKWRGDCTYILREIGVVKGDCCSSCHHDAEDYAESGQYQLGYIDLPNGDWVDACCSAYLEITIPGAELLRLLDAYDARQEGATQP